MRVAYRELTGTSGRYWLLAGALASVVLLGLLAAHTMETKGHVATGMTNEIVWGLPHVFAVFLIVAASGALNIASIASVFGRPAYKPLAPLSGLLAVALLAGGLAVLVLDLGRPERLVVALTHYNARSIFAWNVFLYTGFALVVAAYLWVLLERRMNVHARRAGLVAFAWRIVLTTGTGSIFGFLVARETYDTALLPPLFIALSLAYGLAVFLLVLVAVFRATRRPLAPQLLARLARLLAIFVVAALYFVAVLHLANAYVAQRRDVEAFVLFDGGIHTALFWGGQIVLGSLVPLALLLHAPLAQSIRGVTLAASLVVAGGLAQMYVTIVGGQAFPLVLFPGATVTSSFRDGVVHPYTPGMNEVLLALGGCAFAALIVLFAVKLMPFVPERLEEVPQDERIPAAPLPAAS
ncbi:MAG TPA: NrfD/PsrC family molybdoenzyme membrane anchor subunit [Casimicrobiaceae bacterium]|nr:NrfD/PsrC family molybdoenzyme membrane anchor subunit [Casimicrobiaceae bacterium]